MAGFLRLLALLATFLAVSGLSAYDPRNLLLPYENGTPKGRHLSEYRPTVTVSLDRRRTPTTGGFNQNGWLRILKSKATDITMAFVKETVPVLFRQGNRLVIPMAQKKISPGESRPKEKGKSPPLAASAEAKQEQGLVVFMKKKKHLRYIR